MQRPPGLRRKARCPFGVTLIEVLIAMMIFTIGALGLAAASASIVRQMGSSDQRANAASTAGVRSERFHGSPCGITAVGTEQAGGLRSEWTVEKSRWSAEQDQRITRRTAFGLRADRFVTGRPCE